jgi:hyperosmotically inducible periplasmic protein
MAATAEYSYSVARNLYQEEEGSMTQKFTFRIITITAGAAALTFGGGLLRGAAATTGVTIQQQQPDNTGANKNDTMTADQQKETPADREMAQKIRQSITSDKSLSTYGHNVKVIVRNGTVILKGPVQSEDEKKSIESKAAEVAGATNVKNKLTVKTQG